MLRWILNALTCDPGYDPACTPYKTSLYAYKPMHQKHQLVGGFLYTTAVCHSAGACAGTNICPLQTCLKFIVHVKQTVFAEPDFYISSGFYSDCNFTGILLLLSWSSAPKPVARETCWNGQTDQWELYITAKPTLCNRNHFKRMHLLGKEIHRVTIMKS